ncbi:hypothetical protein B0H67DRAFT_604814 [Lasiosphaeris hirsuta]|uniref:DUF7932 domain-containing protein n=1 Tax=Lasiosphaeris hirsuta TaxID=260670 RepID=A0AA40EBT1_9PEZI|nr:hypothetical protein B0H67DRAFT_604814 [Lasiosphaeris hirsuta]
MAGRDYKIIDTSGRDGLPAPEFFDRRAVEAPVGYNGEPGRSAGSPTVGTPATDIRVRLAYSEAEPGIVQATGEGAHTGLTLKVDRSERLLLKARGGRGGNGGRGDNGQSGGSGRPGRDATKYRSGEDGGDGGRGGEAPHGSVQIKVIRGDLSEATYPAVYILEVVHFDIVDENHDGINEPGEHILVHNIRVRNRGGMPSPSTRSLQLLIQATQWLDPVTTEPLQLPFSIQPSQEVTLPGILRALIRNEWSERAPGSCLRIDESVNLVALFDERLSRPILNFSAGVKIQIRYPLKLDAPTYLDCVAKGDKVRFKWQVHNDSTMAYGSETRLRRACGTKLSDPQRFFALTYATAEKPDEAVDELDEAEPFSVVTIDQEFSVNDHVMEFSDGYLTLELLLADPLTGQMRSVQKHQMRMQISGIYHLSPDPSVLLVVNSSTPNHAIHQIIELLRGRLHTKLDIFNLSLTASYESPVTKRNVLASYLGQTVIVFANAFTYFGGDARNPWDLLDAWETALLLKGGTSLLFANVAEANLQSLRSWAAQATFPAFDVSSACQDAPGEEPNGSGDGGRMPSAKAAAQALRQAGPAAATTASWGVVRFPVGAGLFGGIESAANGSAAAAAKTLTKEMPLRRFVTFPQLDEANPKAGTVIVCEGIPRTAKMVATLGYFGPSPLGTNKIADYDMYFILSCLPFAVRARMFWNAVGKMVLMHEVAGPGASAAAACGVLYAGLERYLELPHGLAAPPESWLVDDKVLEAIGMSLQFDLCNEIYCFTGTQPRFPDPIPVAEKLSQLPLTSLFFSLVPQMPQVTNAAHAHLFASALGAVHALANPLSAWQSLKAAFSCCGNRKGQLTSKLNEQIQLAVDRTCAPDVAGAVQQAVMQRSAQVKAGINASAGKGGGGGGHKNFDRFGQAELASFASVSGVMVHDLTALQPVSTSMGKSQLDQHRYNHMTHQQTMETLKTRAEAQIKEMVNAEDT